MHHSTHTLPFTQDSEKHATDHEHVVGEPSHMRAHKHTSQPPRLEGDASVRVSARLHNEESSELAHSTPWDPLLNRALDDFEESFAYFPILSSSSEPQRSQ